MPEPSSIRPARALLSPAWLLALVLLLANDHWLKYADLAPGWLTGKLSDLAGMVVAPVLLAVLLRVRRHGALLACHVAVGLVFAAIKLSPACADGWSWSMGLLGYPWTIVCDPTDLLALPCLLLAWKLLVPYMDPEASPLVPLQRSAVAGLTVLGLWCWVATTQGRDDPPVYEDVRGQLYLHNPNDVPITFHVREVRTNVSLDCDEVALDPGRLLSPEAFGDAQHWSLDPGVNLGLDIDGDGCGAVWVAGDGIEPTILFVDFDAFSASLWPGIHQDIGELREQGLALELDENGQATWIGIDEVRFTPHSNTPEQPPACVPSPTESRIDWSEEVPGYAVEIVAIDAGLDGCFELTLQGHVLEGDAIVPLEDPYAWYLCAPAEAMPFVAGEFIGFELVSNDTSGTRELTLTLLDPLDLQPATDGNDQPLRRLRLLHGVTGPEFIGPVVASDFATVVEPTCPWQLEPGCATAERLAWLRVVGSLDPILVGAPMVFSSSLSVRTMTLTHVRQRAVVDQACSNGAAILSYDIDLALVEEPG